MWKKSITALFCAAIPGCVTVNAPLFPEPTREPCHQSEDRPMAPQRNYDRGEMTPIPGASVGTTTVTGGLPPVAPADVMPPITVPKAEPGPEMSAPASAAPTSRRKTYPRPTS
jgi:hypothetical protein